MRGSIPVLLVIVLSGCAAQDQGLRRLAPADRTMASNVCPQPGGPEQAQAALMGPPVRFSDLISANETQAYGPTRVVWVNPPDELLKRCP
jgi:hypothetical protein